MAEYTLDRALYALGIGVAVAIALAAASWLFKTFGDEGDDDDDSHFD